MQKARNGPVMSCVDGFEFVNDGRTFTCSAEGASANADGWWWFRVTPDARGQRYAPFRTAAGDTRDDVEARVVAYYDDLLVRRAAPTVRQGWAGRRPGAPAPVAAPVEATS